jgi:hypothetical protein
MKSKNKATVIVVASLIVLPTQAATLQCEILRASNLSTSVTTPSGTGNSLARILPYTGVALGSPKVKNFHVTLTFFNSSISQAVGGNRVVIVNNTLNQPNILAATNTVTPSVDSYTVTIPCTETLSNQCDMKTGLFYVMLSSQSNRVENAQINPVTINTASTGINVSVVVTSNNIQVSDSTHYGHTSVKTIPVVMDSITFPDKIDLGTLTAGENNNSAEKITYDSNTNKIPVFITSSAETESTMLLVNNLPTTPSQRYYPPLTFGLNIHESAQPGTKSASVTARWTCP